MKKQKVWFITGASKGFGLEIAKAALAAGDKVIATVRSKPEKLTSALKNAADLFVVVMDVTKESQVKTAVEQGIGHFGSVDVLVNNAGYGLVTAIEEASDEEVKKQYDTNVFGLLNVTRAVLPHLRKQRSGHIINVSSLFGYDAIPGWALYGSTKFAVEGISKGLAVELAPFNIRVTAIAPGLFRTDFLSTDSHTASKNIIADYNDHVGPMRQIHHQYHGNQPGDPAKLATVVVQVVNTEKAPLHLPVGSDSVKMYKANIEKYSPEVNTWEAVSSSTDFN